MLGLTDVDDGGDVSATDARGVIEGGARGDHDRCALRRTTPNISAPEPIYHQRVVMRRAEVREPTNLAGLPSIGMTSHDSRSRSTLAGSPTARVRPVAVIEDLGDDGPKASGRIELPVRIAWSEPRRTYDLSQRYDRRRVYEQVLSEGTTDDVRYYVRASALLALWDELVVPDYVREAWEPWRRAHLPV